MRAQLFAIKRPTILGRVRMQFPPQPFEGFGNRPRSRHHYFRFRPILVSIEAYTKPWDFSLTAELLHDRQLLRIDSAQKGHGHMEIFMRHATCTTVELQLASGVRNPLTRISIRPQREK